jgi:2',3'-cyclic-nucleotide 2'-phosphodiesterase (5'-nucleotidase family)
MQFRKKLLLGAMLSAAAATQAYADGQVTIIHIGDIHGHLAPRPNLRSTIDYAGQKVGGLARMATEIKKIQAAKGGASKTLVVNTGDTIQGSGEALYTRGKALVDVVDMLGVGAFAPGNWDYVYGPARFKELFADNTNPAAPKSKRWGAIASNLYDTSADPLAPKDPTTLGTAQDTNASQAEYDTYAQWYAANGHRVLPPYSVKTVNGVKIGILGCTTSRGPQVVGKWVTTGLEFTDCSVEVPKFAEYLRTVQKVNLVVLISEIEIGRDIKLIQNKITKPEQRIDVILNSDMHEETLAPIKVKDVNGNETLIIEEGQDGTMIGELTFTVKAGKVTNQFKPHRIDDRIREDHDVAEKVAKVRKPFTMAGFNTTIPCDKNSPYWNSFTESTCLNGPLDEVVGKTDVGLHRSNYSDEAMPAVIEGSSHDFVADAIRWWAKSDMATVRGFRYGTHVAAGDITRNDLFHFVPIGPRIGKVSRVTLNQIRNQLDNSSMAVFSSNPNSPITPRPSYNNAAYAPGGVNQDVSPGAGLPVKGLSGNTLGWGGGWLFAYSAEGFHMDIDPYFVPNWQTVYEGSVPAPVAPATTSASGIYLADNAQITNPKTDTSRARSLTVSMPCKYLPPAEIVSTGCNVADLATRYPTVMTSATDGKYSAAWATNYGTGVNAVPGYAPKDTWLLNPDGWQYLKGTPNNPNGGLAVKAPFQAPIFTAAGYFYAQSPNTLNNCNNCYPTGSSTTPAVLLDPLDPTSLAANPDAPYLLPVNADALGNAMLDVNNNPVLKKDSLQPDGLARDAANHLVADGNPIDLTVIIEKYLDFIGTVNSTTLPLNRIGLLKPLPVSSTLAPDGNPLRLIQPLCGAVGQDPLAPNVCP